MRDPSFQLLLILWKNQTFESMMTFIYKNLDVKFWRLSVSIILIKVGSWFIICVSNITFKKLTDNNRYYNV